jgi:hypothetical protein
LPIADNTVREERQHAWVCTGCLAHWVFHGTEEGVEAEEASRLHRCHVEGATTVIVDASMIAGLAERFGRKPSQ